MKRSWARKSLNGGLIGLFVGVGFFVFDLIALMISKEIVTQGIIGDVFRMLTYVPLDIFSYYVEKGSFSMHDAIAAEVFVGIWFCVLFFTLGFAIALLFAVLCKKTSGNQVE
jgi:hypothetical protein